MRNQEEEKMFKAIALAASENHQLNNNATTKNGKLLNMLWISKSKFVLALRITGVTISKRKCRTYLVHTKCNMIWKLFMKNELPN